MSEVLTPDICVIGGGPGGLSVAAGAAALGVPVVLVEQTGIGGTSLNDGCVASKALIAAGRRAHALRDAARFGITASGTQIDFAAVRDHVRDVIAAIAPNDSRQRLTALGVRVIEGTARFTDKKTVIVGETEIKARRFVIASGSSSTLPPIQGLAKVPYLTSESVFDLPAFPSHLIVIGAGAVGLELAQAFRRLGAAVTVLEAQRPLSQEDRECAEIVLAQIERDGVVIRQGIEVERVSQTGSAIEISIKTAHGAEAIEGSHLLVAAGRSPNVQGLGLENAEIKYAPQHIVVGRNLKTSNSRVYAIGDVTGSQYAHAATAQAGLVIRNALFRLPVRVDPYGIPRVVFTDPELAQIGPTEEELREKRKAYRVLRWPYHENEWAQAERQTLGHIKILTDKSGGILGVTIVGVRAAELITAWTLAVAQEMNIKALAGVIIPYPTLGEIGKRAAATFFTPSLTSIWLRRIITVLRKFG